VCRRFDAIPSIGPIIATALIAAIGNEAAFRKGRDFATWVGLVPREYSTGGKQKLLGISKRRNSYLRKLFVRGARAVLQFKEKQSSGLSTWLTQLTSRTHYKLPVWHLPINWRAWCGRHVKFTDHPWRPATPHNWPA
jgi:transposase